MSRIRATLTTNANHSPVCPSPGPSKRCRCRAEVRCRLRCVERSSGSATFGGARRPCGLHHVSPASSDLQPWTGEGQCGGGFETTYTPARGAGRGLIQCTW
ncbi:hypothetical protein OH76DRAFT_445162 [Lentinus brumalis]|uniref:Uncharacterized protein n=1 Tax=Lentinus brumalis TaxID=2498619 RepID=A0A371DCY7_9APHY|nr:hypothetical protein OH76DRAFT_445162 [Polyporus brumalis]